MKNKNLNRGVFDAPETFYVHIVPGEGGQDSQLFAQDLAKVYGKHADKSGLT